MGLSARDVCPKKKKKNKKKAAGNGVHGVGEGLEPVGLPTFSREQKGRKWVISKG